MNTVWVFGDQLNRQIGALAAADPSRDRVLMVESAAMLRAYNFHQQRLHLVLAAMRHFAEELREQGFFVDYRQATTLHDGYVAHRDEYQPDLVSVTEPNAYSCARLIEQIAEQDAVCVVASNQFLCHRDDFAGWANGKKRLTMESFYRHQRQRFGYLMDGSEPCGGRWNFDADNREPPPSRDPGWRQPDVYPLDSADAAIIDSLPDSATGLRPQGLWATNRASALRRLACFAEEVLPGFGPHEDAMMSTQWYLAHSLLSPYLNLGLLLPAEVCEAVERAYRAGRVPIQSAEGMLRQVLGWREYMWGIYWLKPELREVNVLAHQRQLPPSWQGEARTRMNCLAQALDGLEERAYVHHIQRLMILSNFANLYGIHPVAVRDWMRARYIDGSDWAMVPNVMGMGLWADGGTLSTKPYISGGAYIKKMSDYCRDCEFNPAKRVGADACPFTTLYWDFLHRHRDQLAANHRLARPYANLNRLRDREATLKRALQVKRMIRAGEL